MNTVVTLLAGIALGFGIATVSGKTEKKFIRLDQVTLTKAELEHVVTAIDLLKEKAPLRGYQRYVADAGTVAFDCPTDTTCNLEIPARERALPKEVEVTVHQKRFIPAVALATTAIVRRKPQLSIYSKLGLMNGDVVTAINGENMESPAQALKRLSELSDRFDEIREATAIRDGKPINLSFNGN